MEEKIRVLQCGLGVVGKEMVRIVLEKESLELVGVYDISPQKVDKDVGEVLGIEDRLNIAISDDLDAVLAKTKPHVMLETRSWEA